MSVYDSLDNLLSETGIINTENQSNGQHLNRNNRFDSEEISLINNNRHSRSHSFFNNISLMSSNIFGDENQESRNIINLSRSPSCVNLNHFGFLENIQMNNSNVIPSPFSFDDNQSNDSDIHLSFDKTEIKQNVTENNKSTSQVEEEEKPKENNTKSVKIDHVEKIDNIFLNKKSEMSKEKESIKEHKKTKRRMKTLLSIIVDEATRYLSISTGKELWEVKKNVNKILKNMNITEDTKLYEDTLINILSIESKNAKVLEEYKNEKFNISLKEFINYSLYIEEDLEEEKNNIRFIDEVLNEFYKKKLDNIEKGKKKEMKKLEEIKVYKENYIIGVSLLEEKILKKKKKLKRVIRELRDVAYNLEKIMKSIKPRPIAVENNRNRRNRII